MAKFPRIFQRIFGSTAPSSDIGVFGSLAAGAPTTGTNLTTLQSLSNFTDGWKSAIIGNNSPAIEDENALAFLITSQLAYLFQIGIAEWDASTTYYTGSLVNSAGFIYESLTDNNTNHALSDVTNWKIHGRKWRTVSTTDTALPSDNIIRLDGTTGSFTETLPPVTQAVGVIMELKNVSTNTNTVTVKGNAAELLDLANTYVLAAQDAIRIFCNGTSWDIL